MKRLLTFAFSLSLVVPVVACSNGQSVSPASTPAATAAATAKPTPDANNLQGKIVFGTHRTDIAETKIKALADEFMKANPGVQVTIESYKDWKQILKTRAAASELPDVTIALPEITKADLPKYYMPLDDLGYNKDNLWFYASGLGEDGKLYKVNSGAAYLGVVYSKTAFQAAGITKTPTTTEELFAAFQKLKDKGIIPLGTGFKDAFTLDPYFFQYTHVSTGNANWRNDLIAKAGDLFNTEFLKGFNLAREAYQKGFTEPDLMSANWEQTKKDLAAGKVGMMFMADWLVPQLIDLGAKSDAVGMFPHPESKAVYVGPDKPFVVSKNTKYPEASKAFVKFMLTNSRYAQASGVNSSIKGDKAVIPGVEELLLSKLPIIEDTAVDIKFQDTLNKSQINLSQVVQEYMLSKNTDDVVKKYNDKWQKARLEVLGK
ncbi:ABC transporter substrate-binding protein [Paenibacillus oryzisoli]|uniref:ABC transporter substrate-binding protein n=1 Tax=Paenibacillus oryzisoli TaxID=1850517 RepID=A0A198AHQ2_9BACL|nr:extracellular solute-binding protein [Paenibacillus oryzisoli]OAS20478.1 hypothetical protein A8708_18060 [Paenibacillus oryzisoli]